MTTDRFIHDRLVVIRWREPTIASSRELVELVEARFAEVGAKLFYASLIGPDCRRPSADERKQMVADAERIEPLLLSMRTVLLNGGVRQVMMRGVISGMALIGRRPGGYEVDSSLADMLDFARDHTSIERDWLRNRLVEAGLLSESEARLSGE